MRKFIIGAHALILIAAFAIGCSKGKTLNLATTIGPVDSGMIPKLAEEYKKETGVEIKFTKAGTGEALKLAREGGFDLVIVHAKELEEQFVKDGFGTARIDLMYNDFVVVGPADDPAGIRGMKKAADAFKAIAAKNAKFISRGDNSGTHVAEKKIWKKANMEPTGAWYRVWEKGNTGNAPTLEFTNAEKAYTIMDRATYTTLKGKIALAVLVENDEDLINYISVIPVSAQKFPKINAAGAQDFIAWLTAKDKGQKIISEFGKEKFGASLYVPNSKEWKAAAGK
ncbi:MAG: tungsten ABC transporter permease [Spirochaetes bacterium]|nr:MAG: tungsten ABC transporter permease [Spirochaetota bacterium]